MNANDFFRNRSGGSKQILNQNQFGGVLGGPIKKDKLFYFTSYQQTWQKNGIASQGYAQGITLPPIPTGDRSNTALFQAALGAAFCPTLHPGNQFLTNPGGGGAGAGMQVACDGSNINPIALKYLQAKNADGSYFIPSSGTSAFVGGNTYSIPAYDKEYQGMLNMDYLHQPEGDPDLPVLSLHGAAVYQLRGFRDPARYPGNRSYRLPQYGSKAHNHRDP